MFVSDRSRLKNRRLAAALVTLGGLIAATPALAADFTMKFGTATFRDVQHEFINIYKQRVEKASNGRIEVKIFPRSQLGPMPRQIEGLQLGSQEGFIAPADFFVGVDPRFGVFSIPTLFKNKKNAADTVADPALNEQILGMADAKGMTGLGVFAYGAAHYVAKSPIMRLSDFKGKKLRVNATPAEREKMRRLGGTAVPMPLGEVLPSLQRGVIDGTMSAMAIFVAFKFHDVVKVVTVTNDTMLVSVAMAGQPWLKKLPADLRKIVIAEGRAAQKQTQDWSYGFDAGLAAKWAKAGGTIHNLPSGDLAKMQALLGDVGDKVSKGNAAVSAMYRQVRAVAAKH